MSIVWIFYNGPKLTQHSEAVNKRDTDVKSRKRVGHKGKAGARKPAGRDDDDEEANLRAIVVAKTDKSETVKDKIKSAFQLGPILGAKKVNLRLKKTNGNFVPIDQNLESNIKNSPYILDLYVARVRPSNSVVKPAGDDDQELVRQIDDRLTTALATKTMLNKYLSRIDAIESVVKKTGFNYFKEIIHSVSTK